jgi:hypothetical protein
MVEASGLDRHGASRAQSPRASGRAEVLVLTEQVCHCVWMTYQDDCADWLFWLGIEGGVSSA